MYRNVCATTDSSLAPASHQKTANGLSHFVCRDKHLSTIQDTRPALHAGSPGCDAVA